MIKPTRYLLTDWFWQKYFSYIIRSDFNAFQFNTDIDINPDRAVLILGNHFSWWDGFFLSHLNYLFFHKKFHVMMLEEQLREHTYLRLAGAFSMNKKGKKLIECLNYTSQLLENPENIVVIFPQGKIESMHITHVRFEKGIKRIIDNCRKEIQVIFSVALIDYTSQRKPALQLYLKEFTYKYSYSLQDLEAGFNHHYKEALVCQQSKHNI